MGHVAKKRSWEPWSRIHDAVLCNYFTDGGCRGAISVFDGATNRGKRMCADGCTHHTRHACVRACVRVHLLVFTSVCVCVCVCMSVSACAWSAPVPTTVLPSGCVCTDLGFRSSFLLQVLFKMSTCSA